MLSSTRRAAGGDFARHTAGGRRPGCRSFDDEKERHPGPKAAFPVINMCPMLGAVFACLECEVPAAGSSGRICRVLLLGIRRCGTREGFSWSAQWMKDHDASKVGAYNHWKIVDYALA